MCWSSYGFECCATFAPEYHDPAQGHGEGAARGGDLLHLHLHPVPARRRRRLRRPEHHRRQRAHLLRPDVCDQLFGHGAANVLVILLCAGIVLSMNAATMDGSRALYGISQDGMTIRWFGQAEPQQRAGQRDDARCGPEPRACCSSRRHPRAAAATSACSRCRTSATCSRTSSRFSGFLLLRKDRPNWPTTDPPRIDLDRRRRVLHRLRHHPARESARGRSASHRLRRAGLDAIMGPRGARDRACCSTSTASWSRTSASMRCASKPTMPRS